MVLSTDESKNSMSRSANWKAAPRWCCIGRGEPVQLSLNKSPPSCTRPCPSSALPHPSSSTQKLTHKPTLSHPLSPSLTLSHLSSLSVILLHPLPHPPTYAYHHLPRSSAPLPWLHPRYRQSADLLALLSHIKALHDRPGVRYKPGPGLYRLDLHGEDYSGTVYKSPSRCHRWSIIKFLVFVYS